MSRYGLVGQQFFDNSGAPLAGGRLNFYEPGTTTRKDTFSDEAETSANANPVILDAAGRQGDIFFTGQAKVVLTDTDDVIIDTTDPVGESVADSAFDDYSSSTTYAQGDMVTASNGRYYRSIVGSNIGNEPSASATEWEEFRFLSVYNPNVTYIEDDIVESGGKLYFSLSGSNTGNTPATSPSSWSRLTNSLELVTTIQTGTFTVTAGKHYLVNTTSGAFTVNLPAGNVGDSFGITDFAGTFDTNNLTLSANASEEIMNNTGDHVMDIEYMTGVFTYTTDRGWIYK